MGTPKQPSVRRALVDAFLEQTTAVFAEGAVVLDVGGTVERQRGRFSLAACPVQRVSANLSAAKRPDIQADAAHLPFAAGVFDGALCAELLEHVPEPRAVVGEVARVLRPGGRLIITVPFLYPIHADPHDHGRYTEDHWRWLLAHEGFDVERVEAQGLFWEVLASMLQHWVRHRAEGGWPRTRVGRGLVRRLLGGAIRRAQRADAKAAQGGSAFHRRFTTGYGIVAVRRG